LGLTCECRRRHATRFDTINFKWARASKSPRANVSPIYRSGMDIRDGAPMNTQRILLERHPLGLGLLSSVRKRSRRNLLDCRTRTYSRIICDRRISTGRCTNLAVDNLRFQPDLAGNGDICLCLYRSRSLSHWIGPAGGTRPQPMRTAQNHLVASRCVSAHWRPETIQART
jgi:hypothetical protein